METLEKLVMSKRARQLVMKIVFRRVQSERSRTYVGSRWNADASRIRTGYPNQCAGPLVSWTERRGPEGVSRSGYAARGGDGGGEKRTDTNQTETRFFKEAATFFAKESS